MRTQATRGWSEVESLVDTPLAFVSPVTRTRYTFPSLVRGYVDNRDVEWLVGTGKFKVV